VSSMSSDSAATRMLGERAFRGGHGGYRTYRIPAVLVTTRNTVLFAIREAREHSWVLSTTRHISQGGVCLLDEIWDKAANILAGKGKVVAGDPYVLTVHLPAGFKLKAAEVAGEKAETASQAETTTVRTTPSATRAVEWKVRFTR